MLLSSVQDRLLADTASCFLSLVVFFVEGAFANNSILLISAAFDNLILVLISAAFDNLILARFVAILHLLKHFLLSIGAFRLNLNLSLLCHVV